MQEKLARSPYAEKVKHLSPSKVEAYLKCPESFRLQYVEKVPRQSAKKMTSGNVVHAAIELALRERMAGRPLPTAADLDDVFLHRWDSLMQMEERKASFIGWESDADDPNMKEECRALVPLVLREILVRVRPQIVEQDVKFDYHTPVGPVMVWGKPDLIEEDGTVTDWKTTQKVSRWAASSCTQLIHYSYMGNAEVPVNARKVFLVRGATPSITIAKFRIVKPMKLKWEKEVADTWDGIYHGRFDENPSSPLCKAVWCSWWGPCQGERE